MPLAETRWASLVASAETGRVFLPESAPWLVDYVDSMASFPNATYDDDIDSTTQALNYFRGSNAGGVFEYYRMLATGKGNKPAEPETIRLRVPPGIGGCMIGDTMLQPDAAGTISVSPALASTLLAAGYTCAADRKAGPRV
jgi:hypothetical protein